MEIRGRKINEREQTYIIIGIILVVFILLGYFSYSVLMDEFKKVRQEAFNLGFQNGVVQLAIGQTNTSIILLVQNDQLIGISMKDICDG